MTARLRMSRRISRTDRRERRAVDEHHLEEGPPPPSTQSIVVAQSMVGTAQPSVPVRVDVHAPQPAVGRLLGTTAPLVDGGSR